MRKKANICLMLLYGVLMAVLMPSTAQNENLLVNPGFEEPYNEIADGRIADGWAPWVIPGDPKQIEYEPASDPIDGRPDHILSDAEAQKYFYFFTGGDGGVYQVVGDITPDTELTFSAFVYVWSSENEGNLDESNNPGGVTIQVGIDPQGGIDATSTTIVWSEPVEQFDSYNQYSVTATAEGEFVTVFVRTNVTNAILYTEVYLDDAALVIGAGDEAPTDEVEPVETDEIVVTEDPTDGGFEVVETETPTEEPTTDSSIGVPTDVPVVTITETVPFIDLPATQTQEANNIQQTAIQDEVNQTSTAIVGQATALQDQINQTATMVVLQTTATALIAQATNDALTATALSGVDSINQTATAIIFQATNDAVLAEATNAFATVTAIAVDMTSTALNQPTVPPTLTVAPVEPSATPTAVEPTPFPPGFTPSPTPVIPLGELFPGRILHTVRNGETVSDLSALYGSTIEAIIAANGLNENALIYVGQGLIIPVRVPPIPTTSPTPAFIVVTATPGAPIPSDGVYIVQPGDSLSRIARRYNTTVTTLAQLNGIVNINSIQVGQRLLLPGGGTSPQPEVPETTPPTATPEAITHVVADGDSLYLIAIKYDVTIQRLAEVNQISNPNRIFVGQVLVIPQ